MSSIFTKIINREIPGRFVYEDELVVAFLDISPQTPGHVLVVPREETDKWTDLSQEITARLFHVAQRIGQAQIEAFKAERAGVMVVGFDVPHTHVHVFPANSVEDFTMRGFSPESDEALDAAHAKLTAALTEL